MAITPRPTSTAALRNLVVANPAIFNAAFSRAPSSVRYAGKTYARGSANSPDQKLAYLAMVAKGFGEQPAQGDKAGDRNGADQT